MNAPRQDRMISKTPASSERRTPATQNSGEPRCWLVKSEPSVYGIADLERDRRTVWEGVRNYQARNFIREMAVGNRVLFYHSNAEPAGIAGVARVCTAAKADPTQFDAHSEFFDEGAKSDDPRWSAVELKFESRYSPIVTLDDLRGARALADMVILRRGNRLSVTPVTANEFAVITALARSVAKKS